MSSTSKSQLESQPVYVIENIPTTGDHELEPREIEAAAQSFWDEQKSCVCTANSVGAPPAAFIQHRIATCCAASP